LTGGRFTTRYRSLFFRSSWSARKVRRFAGIFHPTMNKKTKTMFVVQPGGFGSGGIIFSTYEFENNSHEEEMTSPPAQPAASAVPQTQPKRDWIDSAVRLPEAFRRTVWQPLARRVHKLASAA
jgi:hypothetical protein